MTWPRWLRRAVWCFLHDRDRYERINGPGCRARLRTGARCGRAQEYGEPYCLAHLDGTGRPVRFSDRPIARPPFNGLTPRQYECRKRQMHTHGGYLHHRGQCEYTP